MPAAVVAATAACVYVCTVHYGMRLELIFVEFRSFFVQCMIAQVSLAALARKTGLEAIENVKLI